MLTYSTCWVIKFIIRIMKHALTQLLYQFAFKILNKGIHRVIDIPQNQIFTNSATKTVIKTPLRITPPLPLKRPELCLKMCFYGMVFTRLDLVSHNSRGRNF